jgi:hypothetical protein
VLQPRRGLGHDVRRATIRNWLVEHRMSPPDAEAWLDDWEARQVGKPVHRDTHEYWGGAAEWIVDQRNTRRLPE